MKKQPIFYIKSSLMIETLIVVGIIGILSVSSYLGIVIQFQKARDAMRKADLSGFNNNLAHYYEAYGYYPESLPPCDQEFTIDKHILSYETPCDPKSKQPYVYVPDKNPNSQTYKIYTNLEYKNDRVIEKIGCSNGCGPDCKYNYGVTSSNTTLDICAIKYVCAPGGGNTGSCVAFDDPEKSLCPKVYLNDPTCQNACDTPANRCKNASGKNKPE